MNIVSLLLIAGWSALSAPPEVENPLLALLVNEGVVVGDGAVTPLPPPVMADGLDASAQQAIIRELAGVGVDEFLRNSPAAGQVLKLESLRGTAGERIGQRLDLYFVAYGRLETLSKQGLLGELAGMKGGSDDAQTLDAEQLAARGISTQNNDFIGEWYSYFDVVVLDRLRLAGVARTINSRSKDSLIAAARLDERFTDDEQWSNRWRPIERDELGRAVLGEPAPYAGLGGYIKVTPLAEPAGALFIEVHAVMNEPQAWFGGQNYLGSKLPLAVRDSVQSFRRKLLKAEQEQP